MNNNREEKGKEKRFKSLAAENKNREER